MTISSLNWLYEPVVEISATAAKEAESHQLNLTKPPGSLGRVEQIAVRLCAMQNSNKPKVDPVHVSLFAADHGIAAEGVSAFPQAVTQQMLANFVSEGACLSVLAEEMRAKLEIIDVGVKHSANYLPVDGVLDARVGEGTANCLEQEAMTSEQLFAAMQVGRAAAERAYSEQSRLFIGGEMGIANTTTASILLCLVTQTAAFEVTGQGTGISPAARNHKQQIIEKVVARYSQLGTDPLLILRATGGFEIVALVGAYVRCAQLGISILVDGFITAVAAYFAILIQPESQKWMFFGHCSREPGNRKILQLLNEKPLLDLDMALGEASGAMMALPILRSACVIHCRMATFQQASVSTINLDQ